MMYGFLCVCVLFLMTPPEGSKGQGGGTEERKQQWGRTQKKSVVYIILVKNISSTLNPFQVLPIEQIVTVPARFFASNFPEKHKQCIT